MMSKEPKMSKRFYILRMWQTGNIGPRNIEKIEEQPKDGFLIYRDAEQWLEDNIDKFYNSFTTYIISMVYKKLQP